jgi:hypothetical protein
MASMTTKVDSTAQFLDWFKKPFPGQTFTSFTAGMPKRLSSAASRNPPKPYRSPARCNGSPNGTNANEPLSLRRLLALVEAKELQRATTLSFAGGQHESRLLRR